MMLRDELQAGIAAGIAGGVLNEAFVFATQLAAGMPTATLADTFAFAATMLLGPGAYASPAAVPLGIVLYFAVAVGWALGFVYLARTQRHLVRHPWISGAAFGLVVFISAQVGMLIAPREHRPDAPGGLVAQFVAYAVFYGIPVAVVASRLLRGSAPERPG